MIRVLSFGAGRQTVALARMSLDGAAGIEPLDAMVFADTGAELPGTYRAADQIEAACHDRGVRFIRVRNEKARSSGNLFDDLMHQGRPAPPSAPSAAGPGRVAPEDGQHVQRRVPRGLRRMSDARTLAGAAA